jgi:hypothetical protein
MEIFGGFAVMMSILGFFLAVVWLIMPFVVFTIKGKLDRALDVLDGIEKRLTDMEAQLSGLRNERQQGLPASTSQSAASPGSDNGTPIT